MSAKSKFLDILAKSFFSCSKLCYCII